MARLCDVIKIGEYRKLIKKGERRYQWDGYNLREGERAVPATTSSLLEADWELDEPTVESEIKRRGYELFELQVKTDKFSADKIIVMGNAHKFIHMSFGRWPTTIAQVNAICDLLDQYE